MSLHYTILLKVHYPNEFIDMTLEPHEYQKFTPWNGQPGMTKGRMSLHKWQGLQRQTREDRARACLM